MVSRVILHVNAACVAVLVDVVAAVRLDTAGVQVMVGGVTVLVGAPRNIAVCHRVGAALAGHHHIVDARSCRMPTEMVSGNAAEAGAELLCDCNLLRSFRCLLATTMVGLCLSWVIPSASTHGFG